MVRAQTPLMSRGFHWINEVSQMEAKFGGGARPSRQKRAESKAPPADIEF